MIGFRSAGWSFALLLSPLLVLEAAAAEVEVGDAGIWTGFLADLEGDTEQERLVLFGCLEEHAVDAMPDGEELAVGEPRSIWTQSDPSLGLGGGGLFRGAATKIAGVVATRLLTDALDHREEGAVEVRPSVRASSDGASIALNGTF